jgi:hypothetical protein
VEGGVGLASPLSYIYGVNEAGTLLNKGYMKKYTKTQLKKIKPLL